MHPLDFNAELLWAFLGFNLYIDITIETDGLVILLDLKVLRHIWVEVILASKAAIGRNLAVQG